MSAESKVILVLVLFLILHYVPAILYFKTGWFKRFYHDIMGWHVPGDDECDGCAVCKYCGKKVLQDSQGNWFTFE